jgi:uncharacterized protein
MEIDVEFRAFRPSGTNECGASETAELPIGIPRTRPRLPQHETPVTVMLMNVARPAHQTLEQITAAVATVCERHPVMRMQIFGSQASGRVHQGSDVDLLVEFLPEARIGLLEMGELKEDLEDVLGCTVDLISKAAVERSRNPFRRNSILSAPLTVYAR